MRSRPTSTIWRSVFRLPGTSVRLRLTLPFLVVTVVIAGLGIYIVTRLVAGNIEERLVNQLADSAQTATNAIVDIERQQLNRLRLMVNTIGIDLAIIDTDTAEIDALLRPLALSEGIDRTLVVDNQREIIYQLDRTDTAPTDAIRVDEWDSITRVLQNQTDELGDKFVELGQGTDPPYFYTVSPVVNVDGGVVGAIVIGTTLEDIVRTLSNQAIAQVSLYGTEGNVLASTFPADASPTLTADNVANRIAQSENASIVDEVTINESLYQVLYVPFRLREEVVGLKMIALPSDFVANRIGVSRNILTIFFVVFFLAVMGIGWGVSRSILMPLSRLVSTTRQIRSGDLNQRVQLKNHDELGELGQSFDTMTDALVARNRRIQSLYDRQVKETARREAILKSIGDAVIVVNPDKSPLLRNSASQVLIDAAKQNPEEARQLRHMLTNPETLLEDTKLVTFGQYHFSAQSRRVASNGQDMGYVIVFRDITELIELENTKDEIILQISHELRTPLSAAVGYMELLGMIQEFNTNSEQFFHRADGHLKELTYMINQTIEVSAILSNRFELSFHEIDLSEIVRRVVEEQQPRFDEKDLRLHADVPDRLPMIGDERRLQHTVEHVMNNARQYTLPQGMVTIKVEACPGYAQIQVTDTGVGIGADEIDHVFDRLYRGRAADAGETDSRGLGVGLFISQEIVHGHNGTITIESEPNNGTTVTIQLPEHTTSEP
ncbi:MAG: ATP-binding protein [Chloroflexota bacterium]